MKTNQELIETYYELIPDLKGISSKDIQINFAKIDGDLCCWRNSYGTLFIGYKHLSTIIVGEEAEELLKISNYPNIKELLNFI